MQRSLYHVPSGWEEYHVNAIIAFSYEDNAKYVFFVETFQEIVFREFQILFHNLRQIFCKLHSCNHKDFHVCKPYDLLDHDFHNNLYI